jgi:hypothetical protein
VWTLQLALRGELRRVPAPLYAKRYGKTSVHAAWFGWPREELLTLWAEQAAACASIALEHFSDPHEREIVIAAALMRAAGLCRSGGFAQPRQALEVATTTSIFWEALGVPPMRDLKGILASPKARHLREALANHSARDLPPSLWKRMRRRLRKLLLG